MQHLMKEVFLKELPKTQKVWLTTTLDTDKNKDEVLQKKEFDSSELFTVDFAKYDLNEDKSLDFGELYDLASSLTFAQIEKLFRDYNTKFADIQGARISQATAKIGFASEKLGRPSEMLRIYYKDIKKYGNDVANIGVDDILKNILPNMMRIRNFMVAPLIF